jgi:hypothetical protein
VPSVGNEETRAAHETLELQVEDRVTSRDQNIGASTQTSVSNGHRKILDRPVAVFVVSFIVRVCLASVFLGAADSLNALTAIPLAATRTYFYLPYFPIVQNILGATATLVNHAHFVPIGLTVKLIPCFVDSLLSVWFLQNNRFDLSYRRRSAWLYAFCPLPLILVCLQGQWDSLWVLPAVTALALADLFINATKKRRTTLLLVGALLGLAILSKPAALIIAGLLLPSFRYRESLRSWIQSVLLIATGAIVTLAIFFLKFAANGVEVHRNISDAFDYGGQPGAAVFGLADLRLFSHFIRSQTNVALDFREVAIVYVVAIAIYQLVARHPADRMSAAAAALLISPAIGGLAPQYLFWPFVFILASGRLRIASAYALVASSIYFLFFLIPGASYDPGENLGALLPLRSLRFLGLPLSSLKWLSTSSALDFWHPFSNLVVPLAMCALAIFLLVPRQQGHSAFDMDTEIPRLPSLRTVIPYGVVTVLVVLIYGAVSTHDASTTVAAIREGVNRYAFIHPIYSWHHWWKNYFWATSHPYREILSGNWWDSILILGPLGIATWGAFAFRASRRTELRIGDSGQSPT